MSAEPISLTGKLTREEFLELNSYARQCAIRPWIRVLFVTVSLAVLGLAGWVISMHGLTVQTTALVITFLYFPFGAYVWNRVAARRYANKYVHTFPESTVTFTSEAVSVSDPNSDSRLNWGLVHQVVKTKQGLLFLIQAGVAWFYLPNRVFEGNDYRERILAFATAQSVSIKEMS